MKNVFILLLLAVCFCFLACQKDVCKRLNCGENAACDAMTEMCNCTDGYLKDTAGNCTQRNMFRDAYIGNYIGFEQGTGANPVGFPVSIVANFGAENLSLRGHAGYVCNTSPEVPRIDMPGTINAAGVNFTDYERNCSSTRYIFRSFALNRVNDTTLSATYKVETDLAGVIKDVNAIFIKL